MRAWKSLLRAYESTPIQSFDDIAPNPGRADLVLKCYVPGCATCARFDTERRDAFEGATFRGADIASFDCSYPRHRELALGAGVGDLPAYIVLAPGRSPRVVTPE